MSRNYEPLILVVDESKKNRDLIRILLEASGYRVSEAKNALESLPKLEPAPDLLLINVNLPGIGGVEISKLLKKSHLKQIPIIQIASSDSNEFCKQEVLSVADSFVSIDTDPLPLLAEVQKILRK